MRHIQWRWWNEVYIPLFLYCNFFISRLLTISSTVVLVLGEPTTSNWELGACGSSRLWLRSNEPPDARWESGGADERSAASGFLPVRETHLIIIRLLTLLYMDTFMHHPFIDNHTYFQKKNYKHIIYIYIHTYYDFLYYKFLKMMERTWESHAVQRGEPQLVKK